MGPRAVAVEPARKSDQARYWGAILGFGQARRSTVFGLLPEGFPPRESGLSLREQSPILSTGQKFSTQSIIA